MDQDKTRILRIGNIFNLKHHILKRTLRFVLSVTVFSCFLWYSCGFFMLPDQSFDVYFSTLLFSVFTHTLERKYMFLICNGILVFLAKSSPVPSISASETQLQTPDDDLAQAKKLENDVAAAGLETPAGQSLESGPLMTEEEEKDHEKQEEDCYKEVSDEKRGGGVIREETRASEQEQDNDADPDQEEDGGGDGGCGGTEMAVSEKQDDDETDTEILASEETVNADELNRKFEEFIRKMKEEIRIEAQQQLIAV